MQELIESIDTVEHILNDKLEEYESFLQQIKKKEMLSKTLALIYAYT